MMTYRNQLQIMADTLESVKYSGREGVRTTALISKTNVSHSRLKLLCDKLMGSGLINEIKFDGHNAYVITEKGMMYLEEYKKFSDLASSFGLEL